MFVCRACIQQSCMHECQRPKVKHTIASIWCNPFSFEYGLIAYPSHHLLPRQHVDEVVIHTSRLVT